MREPARRRFREVLKTSGVGKRSEWEDAMNEKTVLSQDSRQSVLQWAVERYRREKQGPLPEDQATHWTEAAADRVAFHRALVAHELLLFTRRSIPARIEQPKAANKG